MQVFYVMCVMQFCNAVLSDIDRCLFIIVGMILGNIDDQLLKSVF